MRKLCLVVKREYLTRVRTRGFLIGTFLLPLLMIAALIIPALLAQRQTESTVRIAIIDEQGGLAEIVAQALGHKGSGWEPDVKVVRTLEVPDAAEYERLRDELRRDVSQGDLDGVLTLPQGVLDGQSATLHTRNPGDFRLANSVRAALRDGVITERLEQRGIRVENVRELLEGVNLTVVKVTKGGEVEETGQTIATALIVMFLLYLTVLVYGLTTMRSVMEEKTTRTIEMLVSSLRPFQLLAGKLLGVAAVGFTQYLIWIASGALLLAYSGTVATLLSPSNSAPRIDVPLALVVYVLVFYLAGYFLYASLYAAAGAIVSSDEDAQQVQMPMTLLIGVSALLFGAVLRNPNSTLSVVLSMIPFFSPVLMMERIALQTPPFWQIVLSLLISFVTTLVLVALAAKIYRVGILMYGKRPSLVELWRWLRYT